MDQDRIVYQLANGAKLTGETFLKALWAMAQHAHDKYQYKQNNQTFVGETNYNKFMATNTEKDSVDFKNSELHLDKLKGYLNDYGIGFTFCRNKGAETQTLLFEVKNKALVERSVEKAIADITKNPKAATDKLAKTAGDRTVSEKIAYFKNAIKSKTKSSAKTKGKQKGAVK